MKGLEQKAKKKAVPKKYAGSKHGFKSAKKYVVPRGSERAVCFLMAALPELTPRLVLPLQAQTSIRWLKVFYFSSSLWLKPESENNNANRLKVHALEAP